MKPLRLTLLLLSSLAPSLLAGLPGPELVKDIYPGKYGSLDYEITFEALGNTLFLGASNESSGNELWKSGGTSASTVLVKDLCSGSHGGSPRQFTKAGDFIFFSAHDRFSGTELWRSDGTAAGTLMLKDIAVGTDASSDPRLLGAVGSTLYFTANDERYGMGELWKSNGTPAGTVKVTTLSPTVRVSVYPGVAMGDIYYFRVSKGSVMELWRTNGTETGTRFVTKTHSPPVAVGNHIFFTGDDGVHGKELWVSDGTTGGSSMVKDVAPGASGGAPYGAFAGGNLAYFSARTSDTSAWALWRSDGTPAGTFPLLELAEAYGNEVHVAGDLIYFTPKLPNGSSELWKSDGTVAGTKPLKYGTPGGRLIYFGNGDGRFYFTPHTTRGLLWQSDGTAQGTRVVADFFMGSTGYSGGGSHPRILNGKLLFATHHAAVGKELHSYDTTLPSIARPVLGEVTTTGARIDLAVNPNGFVTSAKFEYGTTESYGTTRYLAVASGEKTSRFQDFPVSLSELTSGTAYHYRITATNERGTRVATGTFRTAFTRETWRAASFGAGSIPEMAADDQDPDRDGLSNLVEYAFGLDPNLGDVAALPKPSISEEGMIFEFTHPEGQDDVIYGVEWSPSMAAGSWTTVPDTGSGNYHRFVVETRQKPRVFTRWTVDPR